MGSSYGGIDPGKTGAIVFIEGDGKIYSAENVPLADGDYIIDVMYAILQRAKLQAGHKCAQIALEHVHATHMGGKSSNFDFGRGRGIWEALLCASGISFIQVEPKAWQKEVWQKGDIEYKEPPGPAVENQKKENRKIDTKLTSFRCATRLAPVYDFIDHGKSGRGNRVNDGIVDAYLIAEYCRRHARKIENLDGGSM